MKNIIALVGPAKSGKTTLILKAVRAISDRLEIIKSVTTRPQRDAEDALSYIFITQEEYEKKRGCGEFVECVEHAGNFYAYERKIIEETVAEKHGICAATEHGILQLHQAGFKIKPIKILAIGNEKIQREFYNMHPDREKDDRERQKILIPFERHIVNSFILPQDIDKAVKELIQFILRLH